MGNIEITSNLPCTKENPAVLGQTIRLHYPEMAKEFHLTTIPNVPYMPVYGGENRIEANFTVNPYVTRLTRVDARVLGHTGNEGTWTGWMAPSAPDQPNPPDPPDPPEEDEYGDVVFSSVVGAVVRVYLLTICEEAAAVGDATFSGIYDGRRQYVSNISLAEWEEKYVDDGGVVDPPDPPDPPEPPEPDLGYDAWPLQTQLGWDTGVMLMNTSDALVNVRLLFYRSNPEYFGPGTLVKTLNFTLGPHNSIEKMVLGDWQVGECNMLMLDAPIAVDVFVAWVSPPYNANTSRSYTIMH